MLRVIAFEAPATSSERKVSFSQALKCHRSIQVHPWNFLVANRSVDLTFSRKQAQIQRQQKQCGKARRAYESVGELCSRLELISFQPALAGTGHVPMSAIARLASDEDTGDEAQSRRMDVICRMGRVLAN